MIFTTRVNGASEKLNSSTLFLLEELGFDAQTEVDKGKPNESNTTESKTF